MNICGLDFTEYEVNGREIFKTMPNDAGVYILAIRHNKGLSVKYIGHTKQFKTRICAHNHLDKIKDDLKTRQKLVVLFYPQKMFNKELENYLLSKYMPPYNLNTGIHFYKSDVSIMKYIIASYSNLGYYEFLNTNTFSYRGYNQRV